ncbi:hypothetical protein QQ045_005461 [Rhodiola kirilowii]
MKMMRQAVANQIDKGKGDQGGKICWKTTSSIVQFSVKSTSDEEQKMIATIQMLAYGSCADQCAKLTRMGESSTLECMKKWCAQVVEHYKDRYLCSPNAADLS